MIVWLLMSTADPQLTNGKIEMHVTKKARQIGYYHQEKECKRKLKVLLKEAGKTPITASCVKSKK